MVSTSGTIEINAEERLNEDDLDIIAASTFQVMIEVTNSLNDVPTISSMIVDQIKGVVIFDTKGFSGVGSDLVIDSTDLAPGTGVRQVAVDGMPDDFGIPAFTAGIGCSSVLLTFAQGHARVVGKEVVRHEMDHFPLC